VSTEVSLQNSKFGKFNMAHGRHCKSLNLHISMKNHPISMKFDSKFETP